MRHPLRSLVGHGFWYSLGNIGHKLGGIVLIPLYTNTEYLSVEAFGVWGVFEVSVSLAVAIIGFQLGAGLIRFLPDSEDRRALVATTWWATAGITTSAAICAILLIRALAGGEMQVILQFLVGYIVAELLLAIPLALLRADGRAATYMALMLVKMVIGIGLAVVLVAYQNRGLLGLVEAFALGSVTALLIGLIATGPRHFLTRSFSATTARRLLAFSTPLIMGGVGGMILNAGDRYVLALLRPPEDIALYTLAAKIGGVVNMFAVQPLQLAFLPIIFRLAANQHGEVVRLLSRYLALAFGLITVCLTVFSNPALALLGADPVYGHSIPLVPWIGLGFSLFGFSVLFDGLLTLHHRTGITSFWMMTAAVANVALNFALVPFLGPLAAAITTFVAYGILFAGRFRSAQRTHPIQYPWAAMTGIAAATIGACLAGRALAPGASVADGLVGLGIVIAWGVTIFAFRWMTMADLTAVVRLFRTTPSTDAE